MAALGAIHHAQTPIEASKAPRLEVRTRLIPIDRLQVLEPAAVDAPTGHAVLELYVGAVPLRFSAPAEMFKEALRAAGDAGAPKRTVQ
jgi:hypothetical protein